MTSKIIKVTVSQPVVLTMNKPTDSWMDELIVTRFVNGVNSGIISKGSNGNWYSGIVNYVKNRRYVDISTTTFRQLIDKYEFDTIFSVLNSMDEYAVNGMNRDNFSVIFDYSQLYPHIFNSVVQLRNKYQQGYKWK